MPKRAKSLKSVVPGKSAGATLLNIYHILMKHYGPQHWWPADEPFEVMVGAILTQSCAWLNVEKAISNLKKSQVMSPQALRDIDATGLARLIHSCGYHNVKARKLKAMARWLQSHNDNFEKLGALDIDNLRRELLSVYGIGEETADSIILYAVGKPVFVIDAYTRRIMERVGLAPEKDNYGNYQNLFMANLPHDEALFNEYHALLVRLAKDVCRKEPLCDECPLAGMCLEAVRD